MEPIKFKGYTVVIAKDQPQYLPLPAYVDDMEGGRTISCWQLSLRERIKILFTGKLWIYVLNFHNPLQPIRPMVDSLFRGKGEK